MQQSCLQKYITPMKILQIRFNDKEEPISRGKQFDFHKRDLNLSFISFTIGLLFNFMNLTSWYFELWRYFFVKYYLEYFRFVV